MSHMTRGTIMRIVSTGALLFIIAARSAFALDFYVAPDGNDANPGTKDHPFATLVRARDAVREAKGTAKTPINVVLRGGTYSLQEPLVLGPEDSGTADCPVTYMAYPGEKPVISGGKVITGWKKSGPGELWTAEIPEVKQGKWYFRQLHVNGQRRPSGRLPAHDLYQVAGKAEPQFRAFKFAPGRSTRSGAISTTWKSCCPSSGRNRDCGSNRSIKPPTSSISPGIVFVRRTGRRDGTRKTSSRA